MDRVVIERLIQPTAQSCGQTCLAMLTGQTVDEVFRDLPDGRTHAGQLAVYLLLRGWLCTTRLTRLYGGLEALADDLAIVRLLWTGCRVGHWVLWDGRLVDPAPALAPGWRATSYLALRRPATSSRQLGAGIVRT